jgi:hypothetical protein
VAAEFVAAVEASGVSAEEPLHPDDEVWLGRLDYKMKMVRHQTKRMHLPGGLCASVGKGLEKGLSIKVVAEDVFASVPATHDVIDCAGELDA